MFAANMCVEDIVGGADAIERIEKEVGHRVEIDRPTGSPVRCVAGELPRDGEVWNQTLFEDTTNKFADAWKGLVDTKQATPVPSSSAQRDHTAQEVHVLFEKKHRDETVYIMFAAAKLRGGDGMGLRSNSDSSTWFNCAHRWSNELGGEKGPKFPLHEGAHRWFDAHHYYFSWKMFAVPEEGAWQLVLAPRTMRKDVGGRARAFENAPDVPDSVTVHPIAAEFKVRWIHALAVRKQLAYVVARGAFSPAQLNREWEADRSECWDL